MDADKVTVVAGKTDNIDFNFAKIDTGSVSGSITDAETGSGLSEAELQAFKVDLNNNPINWPDFHVWLIRISFRVVHIMSNFLQENIF